MWKSQKLYLELTVVDPDTIEVRSSLDSRRRSENMGLEIILRGNQITGKIVNGRFTTTRLNHRP